MAKRSCSLGELELGFAGAKRQHSPRQGLPSPCQAPALGSAEHWQTLSQGTLCTRKVLAGPEVSQALHALPAAPWSQWEPGCLAANASAGTGTYVANANEAAREIVENEL